MTQPRPNLLVSIVTRVVVCGVVLGVGILVAIVLTATGPTAARVEGGVAAAKIRVLRAPSIPVARRWTGYGTIRSLDAATIPSEVVSTVESIPGDIEAGVAVEAGRLIAKLRPFDFLEQLSVIDEQLAEVDAEIDRLKTESEILVRRREIVERELEIISEDLDRVRSAADRGAAVDREVDSAEQRLLVARRAVVGLDELASLLPVRRSAADARRDGLLASRRLAEEQVERCTVVAPFDGVLSDLVVGVGEQVAVGSPIARIIGPERLEIALRIPASCRGRVVPGDRVVVRRTVTADPIDAVIARVSPIDDAATRTMTVYVEIDGRDGRIVPGLFVSGTVHESDRRVRSVVPRRSIRHQRVQLVEDERIRSVPVEPLFGFDDPVAGSGLDDRQWMVLAEPLPEGARIVIDASRSLPEGILVESRVVGETPDAGENGR